MGFFEGLQIGVVTAFQPMNLLYCFIGVLIGTLIGVLPGIGTSGAVAILMPATFTMSPVSAIIMLAGIYYGAMYGGSTTSILVNIPGEAASVVTCFDGYQMARQGRAGRAMGISAFGSFIAGFFGVAMISLLAPSLSRLAFDFGPPEFFGLMVLGLTLSTFLGSGSMVKALLMVSLGLVLGCVGMDPISGTPRLTYGIKPLLDGFDMVPVVMGLFGISEVLFNLEQQEKREVYETKIKGLLPNREDWKRSWAPITRGSILGFFVGVIPGGTAVISSFVSYAVEKRISKHPEGFGKGAIEGVAGPEAANNAATFGSMVPLLTLGIPSNVVMALFLAALMIHGTTPGPMLIQNQPDFFWGVMISMVIGNVMLLILNLPLVGIWASMLRVRYSILMPMIVVFSFIGVYSVDNSLFDVGIMLIFGILGYFMQKFRFPAAPMVLALVLGPMVEMSLAQSLTMSHGNISILVTRPTALVLFVLMMLFMTSPLIRRLVVRRNSRAEAMARSV